MPKVEIDYSNTIFYKIFCKDPTIKELYVGLTTNFVQRKHAHKQSCKNEKAQNHNCKLYNTIRNAGGWENWQMEIIAFHNCKDSYEAHKKEQEYFETLGATLNSIEPLPKPKIKELIMKIVKEPTMITNDNIFTPNKTPKYECKSCDFKCSKNCDYQRHILTLKHVHRVNDNVGVFFNAKHTCLVCNTHYTHASGLSRHKKKCKYTEPLQSAPLPVVDNMQMTLILELVKQNQEFKNLLIQQSNQMMEQNKTMIEVAKNSQVNNTISNNNNNNKTFNLNVFLNETCKDAMNMKDFIQSLELSLPELEKMGEVGFAEGMSRVFVDRLNSLDITKRPIHCSDVKREIIHIKDDNKWERDNANLDRLRKIIKQLTHKNILRVDDWKKANPGCTEYNSRKNEQYLRINMEAIGPVDDIEVKRDFGKIIRRVAENTAIDKKYLCV